MKKILLLIILVLFSCGSRNKTTEKNQKNISTYNLKEDKGFVEKKDSLSHNSFLKDSISKESNVYDFTIKTADLSKPVIIDSTEKGVVKYYNVKSISKKKSNIKTAKKSLKKANDLNIKKEKENKNLIEKNKTSVLEKKSETKLNRKTSFLVSLFPYFLILLVFILLYLLYRFKKSIPYLKNLF